jgi:hypothetical protein
MKTKNSILIFLLLIVLSSCKNDAKKEEVKAIIEKPAIDKNIFTVTLTATVKKDDSFQLFFSYDDKTPFEDKKSQFIEFKGSETPQDIVFKLPENELPYFLRLDFGVNKEQSDILIDKFRIDYQGKSVEIKGSDFFTYFYGNELTSKIDTKIGKVSPFITKEGNYDPMCASAEGLRRQIEALYK